MVWICEGEFTAQGQGAEQGTSGSERNEIVNNKVDITLRKMEISSLIGHMGGRKCWQSRHPPITPLHFSSPSEQSMKCFPLFINNFHTSSGSSRLKIIAKCRQTRNYFSCNSFFSSLNPPPAPCTHFQRILWTPLCGLRYGNTENCFCSSQNSIFVDRRLFRLEQIRINLDSLIYRNRIRSTMERLRMFPLLRQNVGKQLHSHLY